jgi:hemerythrin-like domain-containing protein
LGDPRKSSERALAVILDEHRSIAAVVRGMRDLVQHAQASDTAPDLASLEAMLAYLQAFSLQLHHPKEEVYLHRRLRERLPESEPLLQEIEGQHVREHALVAETLASLKAAKAEDAAATAALVDRVSMLADAVVHHIGLEERSGAAGGTAALA